MRTAATAQNDTSHNAKVLQATANKSGSAVLQ